MIWLKSIGAAIAVVAAVGWTGWFIWSGPWWAWLAPAGIMAVVGISDMIHDGYKRAERKKK